MKSFKLLAVALVVAAGLTGLGALTWGKIAQGAEKPGSPAPAVDAVSEEEEAHGWLGLSLVNLTPRLAERIGVTISSGAVITGVPHNGPADKAGLKRGDVITAVNGQSVANVKDVQTALKDLKVGDTVTLSIINRDGSKEVQVTAEARPESPGGHRRGPRAFMRTFLGPLLSLLPQLREIPRDQRFEHTLGAEYRFTDKDGNPLTLRVAAGTVASADSSNLTVNLNGGGQQQFALTSEVRFLPRSVNGDNIKDGDKVAVSTVNGQTKLVLDLDAARAETGSHVLSSRAGHFGGEGMDRDISGMLKEFGQEKGSRYQGAKQEQAIFVH